MDFKELGIKFSKAISDMAEGVIIKQMRISEDDIKNHSATRDNVADRLFEKFGEIILGIILSELSEEKE